MTQPQITREPFGNLPTGEAVDLYILANTRGAQARITNYGGILVSLRIPDKAGVPHEVVLGYDDLAGYLINKPYFGALVGRYANRIGGARFVLDDVEYQLAANDGANHLHGGLRGFDKALWRAAASLGIAGPALELRYLSADNEEGYPGSLDVTAVYTLTEENALRIDYTAQTNRTTVLNLSHHSYFNLSDAGASPIVDHRLQINADRYTPIDAQLIPTGAIAAVHNTPLDFKRPRRIGAQIEHDHEQLRLAGGYDHNFVLNGRPGELKFAARAMAADTGRAMEVHTTQPGLQFYSGNFLDGSAIGRGGIGYRKRHGFCLETQHFPDSPNRSQFPSTRLEPGDVYRESTVYKFTA